MKPNLFAFATNELSQDAFLAWLIQWADPSCAEHDPALHEAAQDFVRRLLGLQGNSPEQINKVEVERQWERIDVCADINGEHLLIIEDKTGTHQHSEQLKRYRTISLEWCAKEGRRLTCVYLKTHSECEARRAEAVAEGYATYTRGEFLEFLEAHEIDNDIYRDFRERLRYLEDRESQFEEKRLGDWNWDDWTGFYRALEESRSLSKWCAETRPGAGQFLNAVLNYPYCQGYPLYLQIEQGPLCFKVADVEVDVDRGAIWDRFHGALMAQRDRAPGLQRPSRYRAGASMTLARVPADVWLGAPDSLIDFAAVVERLNSYEAWLMGAIQQVESDAPGIEERLNETPIVTP